MMEKAAAEGLLDKSALAVPYSNLASMHKEMGNKSEARQFSELAAKFERTKKR
jgi:hypothetical protein